MTPLPKLLLAAALLLGAVGLVVALVQPGDLAGDGGDTETAQPELTETETQTDVEAGTENGTDEQTEAETDGATDTDTTSTSDGTAATSTTAAAGATSTTTVADGASGHDATTTTTRPTGSGGSGASVGGSGLDGGRDVPRDLEDGLAATGGTSAIGAAVLLGLVGLALRRRTA